MTDKFEPTEEQIQKVLDGRSNRELAIGYLRASHRARQAEEGVKMLGKLIETTDHLLSGDPHQAHERLGEFSEMFEGFER